MGTPTAQTSPRRDVTHMAAAAGTQARPPHLELEEEEEDEEDEERSGATSSRISSSCSSSGCTRTTMCVRPMAAGRADGRGGGQGCAACGETQTLGRPCGAGLRLRRACTSLQPSLLQPPCPPAATTPARRRHDRLCHHLPRPAAPNSLSMSYMAVAADTRGKGRIFSDDTGTSCGAQGPQP
jgi:hypothetical protein